MAASHGWTLDGISIRELVPSEQSLEPGEQYTVFHPSEVELTETTKKILDDVEKLKPTRIVFDSLSELRLLAGNPLRYRRQILALKQFFAGRRCTVLLLDDLTAAEHDLQVQSIAHGALLLEHTMPAFGAAAPAAQRHEVPRQRLPRRLPRLRDPARRARGLSAPGRRRAPRASRAASACRAASPGLDKLLGGGLERGTSTLILGAAGTGKSTLAALFCAQRRRARRALGAVHLRRERQHAVQPARRPGHRAAASTSTPGWSACSRSIPPSSRPASSSTPSAARSRSTAPGSW